MNNRVGFYLVVFLVSLAVVSAGSVEEDRQALEALYISTAGDGWTQNSGWMSASDLSDWYGVETNEDGRVVRLDLYENNLIGELPTEIGLLDAVEYFNVKHNWLVGEIPFEVGGMVSLTHLLLNGNAIDMTDDKTRNYNKHRRLSDSTRTNFFTGSIPSSIGNLQQLEYLEVVGQGLAENEVKDGSGYPGLSGPIPKEIGQLTNLVGVQLGFNSLDYLPESMRNLKNLQYLGINRNNLRGHGLPEWFSELSSLRALDISSNRLGGDLPDLSALTDFRVLWGQANSFTGSYPNYFINGTMPRLNMLELAWNQFTGELEYFDDLNLGAFTVDGMQLSGSVPESIVNNNLINIGFGWTTMNGTWPDLTQLNRVRYIRTQSSPFTGAIPKIRTDMTSFHQLLLGGSEFSDARPEMLAEWIYNAEASRGSSDELRLVYSTSASIQLANNRFTFKDIIPVFDAVEETQIFADRPDAFSYAPQKPFGVARELSAAEGESFALFFEEVSHSDNVYQWYKDGVVLSGERSWSLQVSSMSSSDEGVYVLRVENPLLPDLVIESEPLSLLLGDSYAGPEPDEQEDVFDKSLYSSPRSGFSVSDAVRVSDTVVFDTGYLSDDGFSWEPFSFSGETRDSWIVGDALSSNVRLDARYYAVFSCSWNQGWDCSDTWQVFEK